MEDRVKPGDIYQTLADKLRKRDDALETARAQHTHIPMRDYQRKTADWISSPNWLDEIRDPAYQDMVDAMKYGVSAASQTSYRRADKTLADFGDAELVMEMIRRGYAAMKLPADGGPPEVLR